ncbi:MAG: hypothetical protein EA412_04480 [Chitinophagaceae bacterium]|nr:MAG: hypothetical protein EA412_04480 [Chitinophagaceae bacterium]
MSLMGASGGKVEEENKDPDIVESGESIEIPVYPEAPFSEVVNDDMSFGEAFAAARNDVGAGGFFEWKGASYNTYYKEEWEAMTPEDQKEFMASVNPNSKGDFLDEEAIVKILNGEEEDIDFLDHEDIVIIDDSVESPLDLTDVVIIDDEIIEIDELSDVFIIDENIDPFAEDPFGSDILSDGDDDIIELG